MLYQCGSLDGGLDALLQHTLQLRQLSVESCLQPDSPFPESLPTLCGPTFLSLFDNNLSDLPDGPCWAGGSRFSTMLHQGRVSLAACLGGAVLCAASRNCLQWHAAQSDRLCHFCLQACRA